MVQFLIYLFLIQKKIIERGMVFFYLYNKKVNNDGYQFHQYQQNEQPPLTSNR